MTPETYAALRASLGDHRRAAKLLGCSPVTIKFREEGRNRITDEAAAQLREAVYEAALEEEAHRSLRASPGEWARTDARSCPRVVAGMECESPGPQVTAGPCICHRFARVLDHRAMWARNGVLRLTAEPYQVEGLTLAGFIRECADLGLDVDILGASKYNPGATFLIQVQRSPIDEGTEAEDL